MPASAAWGRGRGKGRIRVTLTLGNLNLVALSLPVWGSRVTGVRGRVTPTLSLTPDLNIWPSARRVMRLASWLGLGLG